MLFLFLFYSSLWLLLADLSYKSLFFGLIAVGFALMLHRHLNLYPPSVRPFPLMGFLAYFLLQSLLSGLDVTKRVLSPKLNVNPGLVFYSFRSEDRRVRYLLTMLLNLTPGTLSIQFDQKGLLIHTLDLNSYREEDVRRMEGLLERIFS